jgi:hypothetical protein
VLAKSLASLLLSVDRAVRDRDRGHRVISIARHQRPDRQATAAANSLAGGNLTDARSSNKRMRSARLAKPFNSMADQLQAMIGNLEQAHRRAGTECTGGAGQAIARCRPRWHATHSAPDLDIV